MRSILSKATTVAMIAGAAVLLQACPGPSGNNTANGGAPTDNGAGTGTDNGMGGMPPADGGNTMPPADGGNTMPPADGGNTTGNTTNNM